MVYDIYLFSNTGYQTLLAFVFPSQQFPTSPKHDADADMGIHDLLYYLRYCCCLLLYRCDEFLCSMKAF